MFLYAYSIKTINYCSNVITAWRRKLNHNNFDTSFVKIDQVLIILWRLKGKKYPFPLLQYIVLTLLIGSTLWWMIWTTDHLMCWFSYVTNSFDFPVYGNEQMVIVTLYLHTSITQFWSILSRIHILASSIPIRQHRWFTVNFTILKDKELFFIWHL